MITRRTFLRYATIFGMPLLDIKIFIPELISVFPEIGFMPDFSICVVRPDELLDLEFGFVNLRRQELSIQSKNQLKDSFIVITVPKLHISEQTFSSDDRIGKDSFSKSYVGGDSYLVFKFKRSQIAAFSLKTEHLLDWTSGRFFDLLVLSATNYTNVAVQYGKALRYSGLGMLDGMPITSLEFNYGLSIAPIERNAREFKIAFNPNKRLSKNDYFYPPDRLSTSTYISCHLKALERTPELERTISTNAEHLNPVQYNPYWYREMISQNRAKSQKALEFKLIGFDASSRDDGRLLPTFSDKRTLFEQFTRNLPNKDFFSDDQLLKSTGTPFRISSLGLSASMEYTSPDGLALLQKLKEVLHNSRDSYVEVQRLGFMYPLGIRIVEIIIGRRKYKNGVFVIERRKYIAPLERKISYREAEEVSLENSENILQRSVDGPSLNEINYIKSAKRCFPFHEIEILNEDLIEIQDQESKLTDACKSEFEGIYQQLHFSVIEYLEKSVGFLKAVNEKELFLRRDAKLEKTIGNEIFQMAADSKDVDFGKNRFADLIGMHPIFLSVVKSAAQDPFEDQVLQYSLKALQDILTASLDIAIEGVKDEIMFACEQAMLRLNKADENIASIKSEGIGRLNAFWPIGLNGNPVTFSMRAKDWDDNEVRFESAFLLVKGEAVVTLNNAYEGSANLSLGKVDKELLMIQQELIALQTRSKLFMSFGGEKLKSLSEGLQQHIEHIELAAYNRSQSLINSTGEKHSRFISEINSIRNTFPTALTGKSNELFIKITSLDGPVRDRFKHLLYLNVLLCVNIYLLQGDDDEAENAIKRALSSMELKIKELEKSIDPLLKERWYRLNVQVYKLDEELTRNYHHQKHLLRRQISIPSQKIAYYRTRPENAEGSIDAKINQLRTELIEFAAIPVAKIADFRYIAQGETSEITRKIKEFGRRFSFTYPQLLAARVRLPVVADLDGEAKSVIGDISTKFSDQRNAVIAYADAYRLAGVEGWKTSEQSAKRNAEQILLEIKQTLPYEQELKDSYKRGVVDQWNQFAAKQAEFEYRAIGYMRSSYHAALRGMDDRLAGLIKPEMEVQQISLLKDKALVLYNEVDTYKGEVESFIKDKNGEVQNAVTSFKDFEKNINNYVIDKKNYFKDLFGKIEIFGLEAGKKIKDGLQLQLDKVPQAQITIIKNSSGLPTGSSVKYSWVKGDNGLLFNDGDDIVKFINGTGPTSSVNAKLAIQISNLTSWEGTEANTFESRIEIKDFGIGAAGIIEIYFDSVGMVKHVSQAKNIKGEWQTNTFTELRVKISKVEFTGFLELVKKLQDALGLGEGFLVDINMSGITISYGVRIPAISTGAFTISNISLYAGIVLSFTGESPSVRFAFAERENPFTLAAGIFGGRGFLAMEVTKSGVEKIEGSLEYGGFLALNIAGIARGQAYLMVGIYFRQTSAEHLFVEAYVTCGGSLSIIGLIQVSVVFHLGMSYQDGALTGRASVRVSISMLFFSASYTLQYEKRITGDSAARKNQNLGKQATYYAELADGNNGRLAFIDALFASNHEEEPFAYLFTEQIVGEFNTLAQASSKNEQNKAALIAKLDSVYDPTLILELEMDFEIYINQFDTTKYE